jgi:hypothetical protein
VFNVKRDKQPYIFDPFSHLGPKRRCLLDESWAEVFRNKILPELPVDELRKHYHETDGRPTNEMYSMVGLMILQQMHDLTDEETIDQFSFNIKWHYALNITGNSDQVSYVSLKSLWNMRNLLTEEGLYTVLFDRTCQTLASVFDVDFANQRIDSVHVQSNMRHLGRIGLFSKTIKDFLVNLKRHHRSQYDKLDQDRFLRYVSKNKECLFAAIKPSETSKTLDSLATDTGFLVERFALIDTVNNMTSYKILVRLFKDQCINDNDTDGNDNKIVFAKPNKDVTSDSLQNPSDPDAGYSGHKGKGYQVQVMETYSPELEEKSLSLITHIQVESADKSDANALLPAIKDTVKRTMSPDELLADSLYGGDDNVQQAKQDYNINVVAPVMGAKSKGWNLDDFLLDPDDIIIRCPQGNCPISVEHPRDRFIAKFLCSDCQECSELKNCPVSKGKKAYTYYYNDKAVRLSRRRLIEDRNSFKDIYRYRAGVEATMSEYDRRTGVKHLRVRGIKAVSFAATLKAIGINIFRAARFKFSQPIAGAT